MPQPYRLLHPGDPTVTLLLGKQKAPGNPATPLRASRFVFSLFVGDGYVLFHTLTKKTVWIAPALIRFFLPGSYTLEALVAEAADGLFDDGFIVREDADESAVFMGLRGIYLNKLQAKGLIDRYIILPVTACNARCVYCYEEALTDAPQTMTDETQHRLIEFIREHAPKTGAVGIQWFGGEPLCGSPRIDSLCRALTDAGISFSSSMITNGSLFTPALAEKAAKDWRLKEAQITLDGTKAEYEKRKRYLPGLSDPFAAVIRNIHDLRTAGIRVVIRLNADLQNIGDLFACVDFLANEFSEAERREIRVYAHELFSCYAEPERLDTLLGRIQELNLYIARFFRPAAKADGQKALHTFDPDICMANPAGHTVVVAPDGKLFACEHMPEDLVLGTLARGIDENRLREINTARGGERHCGDCPFLPLCPDFGWCPSQMPWPHCRRKKEWELKMAMKATLQGGQSRVPDPGR